MNIELGPIKLREHSELEGLEELGITSKAMNMFEMKYLE